MTQAWDPQRIYTGATSRTRPAGLPQPGGLPQGRRPTTIEGQTPIPDLATDTGQSNEDATEWSFTLKDGPKWQDGQPITCEDLKYGVSRTFATDVITGGPNYIIGYLDVPEAADGTPVYKGPYTGEGQAEFDKAVTCDGNTITYRFKKPWPDFPLAIAALRAFDPYRADQDKGDKSKLTGLLQRSLHARRRVDRGLGRHLHPQPGVGRHRGHQPRGQPRLVRVPGRYRDRGHRRPADRRPG